MPNPGRGTAPSCVNYFKCQASHENVFKGTSKESTPAPRSRYVLRALVSSTVISGWTLSPMFRTYPVTPLFWLCKYKRWESQALY